MLIRVLNLTSLKSGSTMSGRVGFMSELSLCLGKQTLRGVIRAPNAIPGFIKYVEVAFRKMIKVVEPFHPNYMLAAFNIFF